MATPNVVMCLRHVQNEDTLAANPALEKRYGDRRKFYSCNKGFNYVSYVNDGSKEKIDYIAYSGDNEKSSGVFDKNGLISKKQQNALKKQLRKTKSVIWDCVISFKKEFGDKYMGGYEDAYRLMKTEFPRFLKAAGLNPDNITWYSGLHTNTDNKHLHISFFENEPTRYSTVDKNLHFSKGIINKRFLSDFKIHVEERLTDISAELKVARQELTGIAKSLLFSEGNQKAYQGEIQEKMLELLSRLPIEGRLSYASENMASLRPLINSISDAFIKSNPALYECFNKFCSGALKKDAAMKEILTNNKIPKEFWGRYLAADKYMEDFYRRMGNFIINSARVFKRKEKTTKTKGAAKRARRQTAIDMLTYSQKLRLEFEQEAMEAFREYLNKLKEAEDEAKQGEMSNEME